MDLILVNDCPFYKDSCARKKYYPEGIYFFYLRFDFYVLKFFLFLPPHMKHVPSKKTRKRRPV
jgi:hypothetical protein